MEEYIRYKWYLLSHLYRFELVHGLINVDYDAWQKESKQLLQPLVMYENRSPLRPRSWYYHIPRWLILNSICFNDLYLDTRLKSDVDLNEGIKTSSTITSHRNHYHVTYLLQKS